MDASDLAIFEAVAATGGMTRAAENLNTVQSNVTSRIRLLEDELGVPLFHRHHRGVQLTRAGEQLLPYARRVSLLLAEAKSKVSNGSEAQGPLQIGSLDSTAAIRLSPLLISFYSAYPKVDLTLVTGTASFLTGEVINHRLEGAFVAGPVRHPDLEERQVWLEEIALYTPPRFKKIDSIARYENLKVLVFRAGCSYRQRLEQFLAKRGILGMKSLEFGSLDGIFGCVAANLGITLFPIAFSEMPSWKSQWKGKINIHRIPEGEAKVPTVFIRRKDSFLSGPLTHFLETIEKF